ncbi:hypothetical protein ACLRGI_16615 [Paenarthrobacter nitroguajacolicus]|uniref:hypothetical protein n=1 Tax=Paenarthrobacter nitroguajacolicus TaxID=211146 RepID=UPI003AE756A8
MSINHDPKALQNPMHVRVAAAFRIVELSDFEARVLSKGYVSREDYDEAYLLYAEKMTAAGFRVEHLLNSQGYYVPNFSSAARDALVAKGDPAEEVAKFESEQWTTIQNCELGTFRLVNAIFHEQSQPSGQFDS